MRAFSLVELSIVLVILGLLTGGILAGQSLIRAAEIRSIPTDLQRYSTAIQSFRDRYMALPGDMKNATDFWGTATYCPGTASQGSTDKATCNGDGDGRIEDSGGSANEMYRFWQQLANAGLVEGSYSGVTYNDTYAWSSRGGVNVPSGRLGNSNWTFYYYGATTISSTDRFEGEYGNTFIPGINAASSFGGTTLTPPEAWNLDTKLDDGKPGIGRMRLYEWSTSCHDAGQSSTASLATSANYILTGNSITCHLMFPGY